MSIVIAGGSGFLGRKLIKRLEDDGHSVTILTRRPEAIPSSFVRVPLDARDPAALAALAMIVTAVPGTAWAELAHDRSALLLHVLSVDDEEELVATIKRRYERPLMEIFE